MYIFNKLNIKEEIKNKISKKIIEYYFDDNKILIKYANINNDEIYMIGYIQDNNTFISEYYIESIDNLVLKYHLSKNKISTLLQGNDNNIKQDNSNKTIGKLFPIKKPQLNNINNNIDDYIKILVGIYNNYEYINNKANKNFLKDQQFDICYIVNQKYINKLKEILNYKEFCKLELKEKQINKIIEEIKKDFSQTQFLKSLYSLDKKIFNETKDNNELTEIKRINLQKEGLYYYKNLEIITNNLYKILEEEHLTLKEDKMLIWGI